MALSNLPTVTKASVATVVALSRLNDASLAAGDWAYVVATDTYYRYAPTSNALIDNVLVVAAYSSLIGTSPARWLLTITAGGGGASGGWIVTPVETAAYAANIGELVQVDSTGGAFNVTLPLTTLLTKGQSIAVKNVSASILVVGINPTAPDTVDGHAAGTAILRPYDSIVLVSDGGTNWDTLTPTPSYFAVATTADLPSIGVVANQTRALNGTIAFVVSQRAYYSYNTVGGTWDRFASDTNFWLAQTDFHLSDAGTVDNTGLSSGSPITAAEFFLRIGPTGLFTTAGTITINLHGTTFSQDFIGTLGWQSNNQVLIVGDIIAVGPAGAITVATQYNQATGQTLRITSVGQTYTPGNFVIVTASANPASVGGSMVVSADLGAGVGEVSPGLAYVNGTNASTGSGVTPQAGDAIQHSTFTNITGAFAVRLTGPYGLVSGACKAIIRDLRFTGTGNAKLISVANLSESIVVLTEITNASAGFNSSGIVHRINVANIAGATMTGPMAEAYFIQGGWNGNTSGFTPFGLPTIFGGFLSLGSVFALGGNPITVNAMQMGSTTVLGRTIYTIDKGSTIYLATNPALSFNITAGGAVIAQVRTGHLYNAAAVTWANTIVTNATEDAGPFTISGTGAINTFTVATGAWSAGGVAMTIASLDAASPGGFAGKACDPRSGASISRQDTA